MQHSIKLNAFKNSKMGQRTDYKTDIKIIILCAYAETKNYKMSNRIPLPYLQGHPLTIFVYFVGDCRL